MRIIYEAEVMSVSKSVEGIKSKLEWRPGKGFSESIWVLHEFPLGSKVQVVVTDDVVVEDESLCADCGLPQLDHVIEFQSDYTVNHSFVKPTR